LEPAEFHLAFDFKDERAAHGHTMPTGIIPCIKKGKESMDIQKIVAELSGERNRLNRAIAALEGLSQPARHRGRPPKSRMAAPAPSKKRRTMGAAARKRISAAMKKRWATWKGKSAPKAARAAPTKPHGRRSMSAAARKKLSELAKARWAERKKAQSA
jgi:hypothetical protein